MGRYRDNARMLQRVEENKGVARESIPSRPSIGSPVSPNPIDDIFDMMMNSEDKKQSARTTVKKKQKVKLSSEFKASMHSKLGQEGQVASSIFKNSLHPR